MMSLMLRKKLNTQEIKQILIPSKKIEEIITNEFNEL